MTYTYDYRKLRGRIREYFGTEQAFAQAMGISAPALSARLNNRTDFRIKEIFKMQELLQIPGADCDRYFFKHLEQTG